MGLKGRKPAKRTILIDVQSKLDYALSKPQAVELYGLSECSENISSPAALRRYGSPLL
jgi:hypothetical protein